jgi:hypothetical protein
MYLAVHNITSSSGQLVCTLSANVRFISVLGHLHNCRLDEACEKSKILERMPSKGITIKYHQLMSHCVAVIYIEKGSLNNVSSQSLEAACLKIKRQYRATSAGIRNDTYIMQMVNRLQSQAKADAAQSELLVDRVATNKKISTAHGVVASKGGAQLVQ